MIPTVALTPPGFASVGVAVGIGVLGIALVGLSVADPVDAATVTVWVHELLILPVLSVNMTDDEKLPPVE